MILPAEAQAITSQYLELIDETLHGLCSASRLHALLATGKIISKTAAGHHGAAEFPSYADLCTRAINHRAGHPITFSVAEAATSVTFGRAVIAAAQHL